MAARRLAAGIPSLVEVVQQLVRLWPLPLAGSHRLEVSNSICLTLLFGDSHESLKQTHVGAGINALFLDGFAPERNPLMWQHELLKHVSRACRRGTTLATGCVANDLLHRLRALHWDVQHRPGCTTRREMLAGRYDPPPYAERPRSAVLPAPTFAPESTIVIGAGLAGCLITSRLAARGIAVTLIDRHPSAACEASGNPVALLRPRLAKDDALAARLARSAFGYALRTLNALPGFNWQPGGVLQLATDEVNARYQQACIDSTHFPPEYVEWLSPDEIQQRFGIVTFDCQDGGWWFPQGGWLAPLELCAASLGAAGPHVSTRFDTQIDRIDHVNGQWHALDAGGGVRASAPCLVLATAGATRALLPATAHPFLPLDLIAGQLTRLSAANDPRLSALSFALAGTGHITPPVNGTTWVGASFRRDTNDLHTSREDNISNLEKLDRFLPGAARRYADTVLDAWVGERAMTQDRLPLAGALPEVRARPERDPGFSQLPRMPGVYALLGLGARGLLWAPLMAELVASQIAGEPFPIPARMANAVDPGRFYLRYLRQRI